MPSRWGFPRVAGLSEIPSRLSVSAVTRSVKSAGGAHCLLGSPGAGCDGCPRPADSSRPATPPKSGPDGSSHRAPSFPPLNPTTRPRPPQCMSGRAGGRLSQERSPVTTVGGPRRDAVDMDLWLDTENRLVLALLHLYRPSSRDFRLLPRPSRTGSDATL